MILKFLVFLRTFLRTFLSPFPSQIPLGLFPPRGGKSPPRHSDPNPGRGCLRMRGGLARRRVPRGRRPRGPGVPNQSAGRGSTSPMGFSAGEWGPGVIVLCIDLFGRWDFFMEIRRYYNTNTFIFANRGERMLYFA